MSDIRKELPSHIIDRAVQTVRYKIVITKYTTELAVKEKSWEEGAGEPKDGKPSWGYTPAIEDLKEVDRIILQQEVPALSLTDVICAVNGIARDE